MAKIKIQDLCDKLKTNVNDKGLFFKELSAREFFEPFYRAGIINFTDEASYWVVQYLQKIYDENTREIIIKIINENIDELPDINKIDSSTYMQLIKLLEQFDIEAFNQIKTIKLLEHKQSVYFILSLYKNKEIYKNKELVNTSIYSLLRYHPDDSYQKTCQIDFDSYHLSELFNNNDTKENFQMALKQDFLFDILVKKYTEVYFITHENKNNITDVFSRQMIDMEEFENNLLNDYFIEDISDIMLYFLYINLSGTGFQITENIKKLLSHEIFILRKLGLYLINSNLERYMDLLIFFLNNINQTNIVKVTEICLYEIISVFKNISNLGNYENLDEAISQYLQKFPKKREELKYTVLHGLKENSKFKQLFDEFKNKYKYEKENPGLYWQSHIGGWVKNVSPISEKEFNAKNIEEQVDYLNSDIKYDKPLIQIDKDTVAETNERGLADLLKKFLEKDINKYINNDSILKLNKKVFIQAVLDVLIQKVEQINSMNKVILFLDNFFYLALKENGELLCSIMDFNIIISEKRHKEFKKIFKYVEQIAKSEFKESYNGEEKDLSFNALNTMHGRNFRCYMNHIIKIKKINEQDFNFLTYIMQKENEDRLCTFYYYLGMQYQYLSCRYKELNLLKRVYKLNTRARKYFLNGYLAYFSFVPAFIDLKNLILQAFKNNEINNGLVRTRFVRMLLHLKLKCGENDIFCEFSKYFSEKDYNDILRELTHKSNISYDKSSIWNFWLEIINFGSKEYTSSLLDIFNKYGETDDVQKYESELKTIIRAGLPDSLVANRSIENFLEKLLSCLKTRQNSAVVYNILDDFISSMKTVKYVYKELDTIKDILQEFNKQGKEQNSYLIAKKIYNTPSIKFYSTNLKEYLI